MAQNSYNYYTYQLYQHRSYYVCAVIKLLYHKMKTKRCLYKSNQLSMKGASFCSQQTCKKQHTGTFKSLQCLYIQQEHQESTEVEICHPPKQRHFHDMLYVFTIKLSRYNETMSPFLQESAFKHNQQKLPRSKPPDLHCSLTYWAQTKLFYNISHVLLHQTIHVAVILLLKYINILL